MKQYAEASNQMEKGGMANTENTARSSRWIKCLLIGGLSALFVHCDRPDVPLEIKPARVQHASLAPQNHRPILYINSEQRYVIDRSSLFVARKGKADGAGKAWIAIKDSLRPISHVITSRDLERSAIGTWRFRILPDLRDSLELTLQLQRASDKRWNLNEAGEISLLVDNNTSFEALVDVFITMFDTGFDSVHFLIQSENTLAALPYFSRHLSVGPRANYLPSANLADEICLQPIIIATEEVYFLRLLKQSNAEQQKVCESGVASPFMIPITATEHSESVTLEETLALVGENCEVIDDAGNALNSARTLLTDTASEPERREACLKYPYRDGKKNLVRLSKFLLRVRQEISPFCCWANVIPKRQTKWQNIASIMATLQEILGIERVSFSIIR
jgi:hypothetical protein